MFQSPEPGAPASPVLPAPAPRYDDLRHVLFGSLSSIKSTVHFLHKRGYAEPNDWSEPMPTGRGSEWMTVLTKRVPIE